MSTVFEDKFVNKSEELILLSVNNLSEDPRQSLLFFSLLLPLGFFKQDLCTAFRL
jgi:hypothetical protein